MPTSNSFSDRLREPLNETSRKVRRNLLAASVIGVFIAKVGLIPSKFSVLGIEFSEANQEALLTLLIFVIAYFVITFLVYVSSELVAWQMIFRSEEMERLQNQARRREGSIDSEHEKYLWEKARYTYFQAKPAFFLRLLVEVAIPVVFAVYSAVALYNLEPPKAEEANQSIQPTANAAAD